MWLIVRLLNIYRLISKCINCINYVLYLWWLVSIYKTNLEVFPGTSYRGFVPTSNSASQSSTAVSRSFSKYPVRKSVLVPGGNSPSVYKWSQSNRFNKSLKATIASVSTKEPTIPAISFGDVWRSLDAQVYKASSQSKGLMVTIHKVKEDGSFQNF